tara:strand:- start:1497 stop:1712 length:216 start_codon:yes stop_codon:yes gene_type:complete
LSKYTNLLATVRETANQLKNGQISPDEADTILKNIEIEYKAIATSTGDRKLTLMLDELFGSDENPNLSLLF